MSTNYYLRFKACTHCGHYHEAHIGKTSAGWSFLFRAYEHEVLNEEHPEWGYKAGKESPFGRPVSSRADWLQVLADHPGEVFDEYERRQDDFASWIRSLGPPSVEQRRFEDDQTRYPSYFDPSGWRDAEGFRFEPREFS